MNGQEMVAVGVDAFGGPLRPLRLPVIAAGPGEVLVRVAAAAVNPADLGMVAGRYRWADEVRFPLVPGYDVAGTVEATGQPVVAFTSHKSTQRGGYAQFVTLPAELVVPLPDGLTAVDAAPLPLAGMTALQALDVLGEVDTLLVNGPRGAVGSLIVQLATARGTTVVPADSPGPVDAAVDVVGGAVARAAFDRVRDHGRYATVVPEFWIPGGVFAAERGITPRVVSVRYDRIGLMGLVEQLAAGTVTAKVGAVLPLTDAAQAHRIVGRAEAAPRVAGKIVLVP
ncbi:zinc-binding dehydrogenase [Actinoplanes sp. KI2]|uniref:alcohol dehydrogenase catalytic domain-containing protein n=1 Tax=Actinoplanes sp. KI2 TaxID=2983315 RepID=UPI0021D5BEA6|nr:zinc-binding dehydrogenase [Actinoplanes sp. KI2]MCU7724920.1 zinc-binding dehydrogenase [Actinoplanes sp. KI2]